MKHGEPDFLAIVNLRIKVANSYHLSSRIVFHTYLNDVFGIALDGGLPEGGRARGQFQIRTGPAAYSAHCARVPYVESAGRQVAQGFWDMVGSEEVPRIRKGLELLVHSR